MLGAIDERVETAVAVREEVAFREFEADTGEPGVGWQLGYAGIVVALVGASLLALGVFMPVADSANVGKVSFLDFNTSSFRSNEERIISLTCLALIALAAASACLFAALRLYSWLGWSASFAVTSTGTVAGRLYFFMKDHQDMHWSWGWAVLAAGTLLLLYAPSCQTSVRRRGSRHERALERAILRSQDLTTAAIITFLLYWLLGIPGLVVNLVYLAKAARIKQMTGESPAGTGCLWALLIVFGVLTLLVICIYVLFFILLAGAFRGA